MGIGVALGLVLGGDVFRLVFVFGRARLMLRRLVIGGLLEDNLPGGVAPELRELQETFRYASALGNADWAGHLARLFAKFSRERPNTGVTEVHCFLGRDWRNS